jgi:SAM-dependent methyltransferase
MSPARPEEQLREEFNRWADSGRGEEMEHDHWPITRPVVEQMRLAPGNRILDVGCGAGWLSRILAERVPEGSVIGMDISDEMIRHAREKSTGHANLEYIVGQVASIPWEDNFFTHAVSVESAYYWPDPAKGIREIYRVLKPGGQAPHGGQAWIDINYYRDNPHSQQWGKLLGIPTHWLSAEEWKKLFRDAGFDDVAHQFIPDPTPNRETYTGRWFRDARQLAEFRAIGALLVHGSK